MLAGVLAATAIAGCGGAERGGVPAPNPERTQDLVPLTTAQAPARADRVVLATSRGSRVIEGMPGTPFTRTTFDAERVLKGRLAHRFVIQTIGGRLGNVVVSRRCRRSCRAIATCSSSARRARGPDDLPAIGVRYATGHRDDPDLGARAAVPRRLLAALPADGLPAPVAAGPASSGVLPDRWQALPVNLTVDNGPTERPGRDQRRAIATWNAVPTAQATRSARVTLAPRRLQQGQPRHRLGQPHGRREAGGGLRRGRQGAAGARLRARGGQRLRRQARGGASTARPRSTTCS